MSFLESLPPDGAVRDATILGAIHTGNLNPVTWVWVTMGRIQIQVSSDYLGIAGEHVPMSEHVAQAAVTSLGALLPTPFIVDAIEKVAAIVPLPTWAPPKGQDRGAQTSSEIFALCETNTRLLFGARGIQPGQLVAGHRKDVVITRYMPDGVVCIYGARWPDGRRLQPLYPIPGGNPGHEHEYEDYSHGVRAVLNACLLDGQPALVSDILSGPLASLLGGPVARFRYPLPSTPATDRPSAPAGRPTDPAPAPRPTSKVLRMGDSGPRVLELQQLLTAAHVETDADGIFGKDTRASVVTLQRREGLDADGLVGDKTMGALHRYRDEQGDTLPDAFDASDMPLPLSDDERERVYGSFEWSPVPGDASAIRILGGWEAANIRTIEVPQLRGIQYAGARGLVRCHKLIVDPIRELCDRWERAGLTKYIVTYDGCHVARRVRGSDSLSSHSWGSDFDINALPNMRGKPLQPMSTHGAVLPLLPIAKELGWGSGGRWPTPDWMHLGFRG